MSQTQPSFQDVLVDVAKLRDYCLSETHPRGRHEARMFKSRFGWNAHDAEAVRQILLDAAYANASGLRSTGDSAWGRTFRLDVRVTTPAGSGGVRSLWIIQTGQDSLRLTTCYLL